MAAATPTSPNSGSIHTSTSPAIGKTTRPSIKHARRFEILIKNSVHMFSHSTSYLVCLGQYVLASHGQAMFIQRHIRELPFRVETPSGILTGLGWPARPLDEQVEWRLSIWMARAPRASPQIFDSTDRRNKLLSRTAGTEGDHQQDGYEPQFYASKYHVRSVRETPEKCPKIHSSFRKDDFRCQIQLWGVNWSRKCASCCRGELVIMDLKWPPLNQATVRCGSQAQNREAPNTRNSSTPSDPPLHSITVSSAFLLFNNIPWLILVPVQPFLSASACCLSRRVTSCISHHQQQRPGSPHATTTASPAIGITISIGASPLQMPPSVTNTN